MNPPFDFVVGWLRAEMPDNPSMVDTIIKTIWEAATEVQRMAIAQAVPGREWQIRAIPLVTLPEEHVQCKHPLHDHTP